jgi:hypothetical protein
MMRDLNFQAKAVFPTTKNESNKYSNNMRLVVSQPPYSNVFRYDLNEGD